MTATDTFEVGDTVISPDFPGPKGVIQSIREETVRSTMKDDSGEEKGITVTVLWANGTLSHFVPGGLKKA